MIISNDLIQEVLTKHPELNRVCIYCNLIKGVHAAISLQCPNQEGLLIDQITYFQEK